MNKSKKKFVAIYVNLLLIFILHFLRASGLLSLAVFGVSPIILLPLVVSIAMFFGEWRGATAGFLVGLLMDSLSMGSSIFNSLCIMAIGLLCGIAANFYLNKNIKSAFALSASASFAYYFLKFLFLSIFVDGRVDGKLFADFLLPGVVYTSIFIIPFYFLERKLKDL